MVAQVETWSTQAYDPKSVYAAAALAMTVPLAWRRSAPLLVLGAVFIPLLALAAAGEPVDSAYVMLVLLVAFSATGAYCDRRRAVAGLVLGLSLLAAVLALENAVLAEGVVAPAVEDYVFIAVIVGAVWGLSLGLRERSLRAGELEQRVGQLAREQEERALAAVAEERAHIARELHDVVAHSVSMIAVQTGSLRRRLRHERPVEAKELAGMEQTAREALAEMRRMLGLLRSDDEATSLAPQPGLDEVGRLVEHACDAGVPVELEVVGQRRPLPPGVDLAAYRILQEALTNVLKHAGPARARVCVHFGERELKLEISDDGRGPSADGNGDGHGLVGMRERVLLYGGSLEAAAHGDGGFVVSARLPIATL